MRRQENSPVAVKQKKCLQNRILYVMIATNCVLIARRRLLYDAHYLQVAQTTLQDYSVS